jgi:TonB family protein
MLGSNRFSTSRDPVPSEPYLLPPHYPRKQQRLMIAALGILLFALGFVLYSNRDFWFPDAPVTDDQNQSTSPVPAAKAEVVVNRAVVGNKKARSYTVPPNQPAEPEPSGATITATRTILPPLEVEVVAGNTPRPIHPANNSIQVDLEQGSTPLRAIPEVPVEAHETAANIMSNAAERADVSTDTAEVVSHSVTPGYPTLARQMKVQGSVILLALIGRDGLIQDLHVVSGPPILANAALEAVRQWHFKPHYQGTGAVETQARITVNFTISTN